MYCSIVYTNTPSGLYRTFSGGTLWVAVGTIDSNKSAHLLARKLQNGWNNRLNLLILGLLLLLGTSLEF